jgi:hypothetical protein
MSQLATIRFRSNSPELFAGDTGVVDEQNFTIRGVSCITSECEAEGHSLFVDKTTLTQLHDLSKSMGQVPVTINHEGKVEDVNGWLQNFRVDGNKLRADWVLLETHKETPTMLERARKQPKTFGLSFSFKGDPKGTTVNGRQCARAEQVMSCDVVKRAAANKGGLFSSKEGPTSADLKRQIIALAKSNSVDTRNFSVTRKPLTFMADPNNQNAEPSLQDILNEVRSMRAEHDAFKAEVAEAFQSQGQQEEPGDNELFDQLSQLNAMSDEELAANGITRDEVDAAVGEYNANLGGEQQGQEQGGEQYGGEQGGYQGEQGQSAGAEMSGAGAAAGAGSAQFAALQRELIQLKAKFNAKEQAEINFAEAQEAGKVEAKFIALANQNRELQEFSARAVAQIEALELHVRTGTRPVKAGVDNGIRLFHANSGELHPFQARLKAIEAEKKCTPGQAILFAMKEPNGPALHADWVQSRTIHA